MKTTCYRNITWQSKAWHEATQSIQQKSLTYRKPKGIRKYNGNHVNIAIILTDSDLVENWNMAKQISSRHVYELDALTTEHVMTI